MGYALPNSTLPQFNLDEVIASFGVGRVIRSKDSNYVEAGIVVSPFAPFAEYCVVPYQFLTRKIDPNDGIPLPEYISGAVGMYAGQLAKHRGYRVIGSTGSDEYQSSSI
ncbi:unnamed protein product [Malus baccata var. baccata]